MIAFPPVLFLCIMLNIAFSLILIQVTLEYYIDYHNHRNQQETDPEIYLYQRAARGNTMPAPAHNADADLAYIINCLKNASDFKVDYRAVAADAGKTGPGAANNAQKRFKAIIEKNGEYKLVAGCVVSAANIPEATTTPATTAANDDDDADADEPAPPTKKRKMNKKKTE